MRAVIWQLLHREWQLSWRRPGDVLNPLVFFAMVITLFPLAVGPEPQMLQRMASGVIWVAALLATLLSLDGLFRSDFEDGSLEQWVLSPHPLTLLVLVKVLHHWLMCGVLLVLLTPLLGMMLALPWSVIPVLCVTLLLGTAVLSLLGAIGAALTVGLKGGGSMLLALLILPLYIPVLILGTGTMDAALQGLPVQGYLLWMSCLAVLALSLSPLAIAAGLRIGVSE
ncbi:heme exporter protein CcmB [Halopseudomonas pachastrellae]|jgi:heme exporter protein B|uniref:Heme exporter protein B n=1 Tax=Halopseudomonas pachastrellae TaxID=254161 RepID=A0A1S8DFA7_9GAMM|nr:heme exporter protein CcmB [Halopseudomonas pachastrellae]MAB43407.1 heme exporter protein CcmB [Pseudomonadales bacterium]MED5490684.1 heme exporter protein CcmB [Pseudomonadota bacterium]HCB43788.1 heme exporter protein CcmB [Pseudomonas sp.]ONM44118.1 heme exporter protein CcmB [Halopseudomonas pachastrellae]SFM63646.1 heme exporter protein B [Halopseudomonas pachastrellae]|tara:strand:- start:5728 stop:6402 length:675 start_codon:yes stop_codon:yes gene_type:complete